MPPPSSTRSAPHGRVLQLPGAEFGAFRWGYTVDQPLPGLTDKPLITRDLLPLGSAGAMDLLYALDDRVQDGVFEPSSLAPVSRWLGVDTVWVANDLAFDRFRTARPQTLTAQIAGAPGVGAVQHVGAAVVNEPAVPMIDEQALADPDATAPTAPVDLYPITPPGTIVRAADHSVVVSGSGDGLVDLAAAGLLDGDELVQYSASLDADGLQAAIAERNRRLRHRLESRSGAPLAQLAGRDRIHRVRSAEPRSAARCCVGRPAAGVRRPRRGRRSLDADRGAPGRARHRHRDLVRRAVRVPARASAVHGDRRRPGDGMDGR